MSIFSFSDYPKAVRDFTVAVVVSEFNEDISEGLLETAFKALRKCKINKDNIDVAHVSGAFEIPFMVKILQSKGQYDGILTLGCVIKGETPHFNYVCQECARGVMERNLFGDIPVSFGVLTCLNHEQAAARLKKGEEAVIALVNQMNLVEEVNG